MMNRTIFRTLQQRSYNVTNIYFLTSQLLFPITILHATVMQVVHGSTQEQKKRCKTIAVCAPTVQRRSMRNQESQKDTLFMDAQGEMPNTKEDTSPTRNLTSGDINSPHENAVVNSELQGIIFSW